MSEPRYGVQSMVDPLRRVLIRRPATTGDFAAADWRQAHTKTLCVLKDIRGMQSPLYFLHYPEHARRSSFSSNW